MIVYIILPFPSVFYIYNNLIMQASKKKGEVKQTEENIPDNEDLMKKGVYIMKDGSRYDGTVLEGDHGILVRHGNGTFTDQHMTYTGSWNRDKMNGKGKKRQLLTGK